MYAPVDSNRFRQDAASGDSGKISKSELKSTEYRSPGRFSVIKKDIKHLFSSGSPSTFRMAVALQGAELHFCLLSEQAFWG